MTASRSMVKLYECGHREIAGVLTEHAINQAIPLGCRGPCRQCVADGAEPAKSLAWNAPENVRPVDDIIAEMRRLGLLP